jgi:nitroreductase
MGNLMNGAAAVGVGSCWINRAKEEFQSPEGVELLKAWGLPEHLVGVGHCILGYADCPNPEPAPRKADFVKFIK